MKTAPLHADEAERLRVLRELRILDTEEDPALAAIARLACAHSGWPIGAITLVDAERQWFPASVGLAMRETPREVALCAHTILGCGALQVEDTHTDVRFADNPLVTGAPHIRAYAGVPVVVDGQAIGTVCTIAPQPQRLDAGALAALSDLADLTSALLESRLQAQRWRVQEARVRGASRAGSDWLWESDAEGRIRWVSDSVEAHTGRSPADEIGRMATELNRPPGPTYRPAWDAHATARAARQAFRDAIAERDTSRGPILIAFSGDPVFDRQGGFRGYRGAARNVTAELALRDTARQAQQLLRDAMEQIDAAMLISDRQGHILFTNAVWRRNTAPFTEGKATTWEGLLREMLARGAYPEARGREEAFLRWRLGVVDTPGQRHEMRFGDKYLLMTDQRLGDGSVLHLSVDITERKHAELRLAAQEAELRADGERMRAVLQSVPDLWFVVDAETRYVECSDEQHPWLGRPFAELRGQRFADVVPPALARAGEQAIAEALRSGNVQRHAYTMRVADGTQRELEARVSPMPGGLALYLTRDLTELRSLERHVDLLQRALEAEAALPMVIADATRPDLPLTYVNPAFERLSGYTRAEVIGRNCRFLQDGEANQPALATLRAAIAAGEPCSVLLRNRRKDGSLFINELHIAPVQDAQGRLTHYIGVQHDVTERSRAAEQLALAEARWSFALDGAGYGVWDYDEEADSAFFSPRWKQMLGHADAEIGASLQEWLQRIHPEDHDRVVEAIRRYRAGETEAYETQHRLRHRDGHWIWVLDRAKIVERRADGSPRRVVGTHSDITRQKLADQALRDQQAAELASRAKTEFLSRMSHEMRTPLNAVIGFTQLLRLHGGQDRTRLAQYSEHILQAGQHLLALVNDVLDLQQVEEGRLALHTETLALDAIVAQALDLVRPLAATHAIGIDNAVAPGTLVQADAQRLRQVLLNVLSNGVKYNREGGELRCRLEDTERADAADATHCALLVEDNGPGLDAAQLARLFQPFERLGRESSTVQGSGLGLIIARRLLEEMGGALQIDSRPGAGTRVRLTLRRTEAAQTAGAPPPSAPDTTAACEAPAGAPLRMLYVEDNRINALLFDEAIKLRGGVELRIAEDGDEALELVAHWSPEVLVLDANLPGMTGYELLRKLRENAALVAVPAFMCSADAMPDDVQRARHAGFHGYWTKPIDIARVLNDLDALPARATPTA